MYRKYTRIFLTAACCAVFSVSASEQTRALELFGICFSGDCKASQEASGFIDPRTYDLDFQITGSSIDETEDSVKGSSELWLGKDAPVAGGSGLISRAKGDYRRILAGLYNLGYYGGSISIRINGREASDITAGSEVPQNSDISILVDTGPLYRFGQIEIINQAPFTEDPKDQVNSLEKIGFQSGLAAEATAVKRAERNAREAWRQLGYPLAKIESKSVTALHPEQLLNVTITVDQGPKANFGQLTVEGTERMDPEFVSYMADIEEGEEYDPDDLKSARKRLDRLGVFSSRKLQESESVTNGMLPIDLDVSERKLRRIGIGATISSVDGAGLESFWLHRNLAGKAERLRLDGKIGGFGRTSDPKDFDYLFSATLTQPGAFSPDTDLIWNAFTKQEINDTYEETSAGASVDVTNYHSDEITYTIGAFGKYGDYVDAFGRRSFITAGFDGDLTYDNRDDKIDPTKGFYAQLKATPFYEFQYENLAARIELEGRTYLSLDTDGESVLAGRVKLGTLLGPSIAQSPPDMLFTAGGGTSVRGYSFKGIGIPTANGDVSGGRSLFESSLEFRRRINEQFGAVAFVDAGTVNSESFVDFEEELKVGVGMGIRYYTGLGPIRLDVAFPLDPGPNDPDFAFYAGIGQAF